MVLEWEERGLEQPEEVVVLGQRFELVQVEIFQPLGREREFHQNAQGPRR
jgi:hypothetical protein